MGDTWTLLSLANTYRHTHTHICTAMSLFDVARCSTALPIFPEFFFLCYTEADKNFTIPGRSIHVGNAFVISLISIVTTSPLYHDNRCLIKSAGGCFQWKLISMAIPVAHLPLFPSPVSAFGILSFSRYEYLVVIHLWVAISFVWNVARSHEGKAPLLCIIMHAHILWFGNSAGNRLQIVLD